MRLLRLLPAAWALAFGSGIVLAEATATIAPVPAIDAAAAVDATAPVTSADVIDTADSCDLNFTPADPEDETLAVSAKACKACQDRPWCKCTYNGLPRVSCNPCCYGNLGIPQTCFD
jgi:hypothetical protein